jgi:putative peptide zinc metalloprotease protein
MSEAPTERAKLPSLENQVPAEPAAGPVASAQPPAPLAPGAADGRPEPPPRLADGIELVGRFEDSGFKEPPYIVRRSDGQVIQLPHLLYLIAEHADGRRAPADIGARVSEASGVALGAEEVGFLVEKKLRPLGVLAQADGSSPKLQKVDPLLALKYRAGVVPERLTWALTTIFKPLFVPPLVVAVVVGLLVLDGWLLFAHGIAPATRELLYNPALLLMLFAAVVLATAFHEIGHATACRYGGAKPGKMGVGLYVVWPVFYTDVTDAYRLGRWGRLRTDLGGIYFNAIFALATAGIYFATRFEPLLLIVLLQNFAMLQQLLPFLRLDGYYVISDLTGVPDMFSRIKPTLRSLIPGRPLDERVAELKPWVRRVVVAYVGVLVPLIAFVLVMMAIQAPRVFATAYDSLGVRWDEASAAFGASEPLTGVGAVLQMLGLVVPALGIALTGGRIGARLGGAAWGWSDGEPPRRVALVAGTAAAAGLALFVWWPNGEYRPIQPGERGTLAGAVKAAAAIPTGRPALTPERERELAGAPSERERRAEDATRDRREPAERDEERGEDDAGRAPAPDEDAPAAPEQEAAPEEPLPTEPQQTAPEAEQTVPEETQTVPQDTTTPAP